MSEPHTASLITTDHDGDQAHLVVVGRPAQAIARVMVGMPEGPGNLRRLAACWNACHGIPTPELEARLEAPADDKQKRTTAALQRWIDAMDKAGEHIDALIDTMGLEPEGPTCTAVFALQGALTAATADLVGDSAQWLEWFWSENDMGRRGHEAGPKDARRPIRTAEDLAWLIALP